MKLFPWGPWKGVVSSASAQANCLIEYYILIIIRRRIGSITPRNNVVFVPIRLPNQFARRAEMTRPLPAKKPASLKGEWNMQSLLEVLSAILSFLDIRHLHICHNAPSLPPKIAISIVFNFSWDSCNTQEKRKAKVMQNFLGGK